MYDFTNRHAMWYSRSWHIGMMYMNILFTQMIVHRTSWIIRPQKTIFCIKGIDMIKKDDNISFIVECFVNKFSESRLSGAVWSARVFVKDPVFYCLETPLDIHKFEMDLGKKIEFFKLWEKPPTMRDAGIEWIVNRHHNFDTSYTMSLE